MTSISRNMYINKLEDINKCNDTYHKTINIMMRADVESYNDFDKDHQFKVGDHLRTSKYKNIFAKGNFPNWCEEVL